MGVKESVLAATIRRAARMVAPQSITPLIHKSSSASVAVSKPSIPQLQKTSHFFTSHQQKEANVKPSPPFGSISPGQGGQEALQESKPEIVLPEVHPLPRLAFFGAMTVMTGGARNVSAKKGVLFVGYEECPVTITTDSLVYCRGICVSVHLMEGMDLVGYLVIHCEGENTDTITEGIKSATGEFKEKLTFRLAAVHKGNTNLRTDPNPDIPDIDIDIEAQNILNSIQPSLGNKINYDAVVDASQNRTDCFLSRYPAYGTWQRLQNWMFGGTTRTAYFRLSVKGVATAAINSGAQRAAVNEGGEVRSQSTKRK